MNGCGLYLSRVQSPISRRHEIEFGAEPGETKAIGVFALRGTSEEGEDMNFKGVLVAVATGAVMFGAMAVPALAAGSGNAKASPCGAAHGAFADQNGNFGFLGEAGGTPGYHNGAVGQEPGATGSNNSHTGCQAQK